MASTESSKRFSKSCIECGEDIPLSRVTCPFCGAEQGRKLTAPPLPPLPWSPPPYAQRRTEKAERETAIDALCEHLRRMGLNATVDWKEQNLHVSTLKLYLGLGQLPHTGIIGSIRIADRNIDAVELDWQIWDVGVAESSNIVHVYRCDYVVQVKVKGLADKLMAESKPVEIRRGFLRSEVVDFRWEGKELADTLNDDIELKKMLYPPDGMHWKKKSGWTFMAFLQIPLAGFSQRQPYNVEIVPDEENQSVRISRNYYHHDSPADAFPTIENFEAYDKIAYHVRSVANARL